MATWASTRFAALGTNCLIRVRGTADEMRDTLEAARSRVTSIHDEMSIFDPSSAVSRLNDAAGTGWTSVPDDVVHVLARGRELGETTGGAFDVTVAPLAALWKPCIRRGCVPTPREVDRARRGVGWGHVRLDEAAHEVAIDAGTSIDLGGIAKGFAADEVVRILRERGVSDALVDLGGSITVLGSPEETGPWRVGIQNPLAPTGASATQVLVRDVSVVTSGTNERFFMRDGRRYHHVVDPSTGWPSRTGLLGVTVIARDALAADALATAILVASAQRGVGWVRALGLEAVLIFEDGGIVSTAPLDVELDPR